MITESHYNLIKDKYGNVASWAIWSNEGDKPKSNIDNLRIFDIKINPDILKLLKPNILMVGLNISRKIKVLSNFHNGSSNSQDFKIRYAFRDTPYYGAYMTDIIKGCIENSSAKVISRLRTDKEYEKQNINTFETELNDLKVKNPLIIVFGNAAFEVLNRYFSSKYRIIKIPHYSKYIGRENYRKEVLDILSEIK